MRLWSFLPTLHPGLPLVTSANHTRSVHKPITITQAQAQHMDVYPTSYALKNLVLHPCAVDFVLASVLLLSCKCVELSVWVSVCMFVLSERS